LEGRSEGFVDKSKGHTHTLSDLSTKPKGSESMSGGFGDKSEGCTGKSQGLKITVWGDMHRKFIRAFRERNQYGFRGFMGERVYTQSF